MPLYQDEGVVLRTVKLGEADRIVTLLTRDHGKIRAVAKGVRRTKSRFGGRFRTFHARGVAHCGRTFARRGFPSRIDGGVCERHLRRFSRRIPRRM